jgi:hypothetical protein
MSFNTIATKAGKNLLTLPDLPKKPGKVTGLFQKSSPELPVFSKNDRIASGKFREKTGPAWI